MMNLTRPGFHQHLDNQTLLFARPSRRLDSLAHGSILPRRTAPVFHHLGYKATLQKHRLSGNYGAFGLSLLVFKAKY
jgi:hypothetical protein